MSKFVLKKIKAVKGVRQFKQLVILSDSQDAKAIQKNINEYERGISIPNFNCDVFIGVLDEFERKLEDTQKSSFKRIITSMNLAADNNLLPEKKFKELKLPKRTAIKEYEFKCNDLRIYAIKIANGMLIIHCGYKNNQDKDIITDIIFDNIFKIENELFKFISFVTCEEMKMKK